ncbi:MAG: hypothetical protein QM820_26225 [Minicystis sp.]
MRHLPEIAALITLGTAAVIGVGCAAATSDAIDQEIVSDTGSTPCTEAPSDPTSAPEPAPPADPDAKKAPAPQGAAPQGAEPEGAAPEFAEPPLDAAKTPAPTAPSPSAAPGQSPEPSASVTAPENPPPQAQAPHAPVVAWDALTNDETAIGRAANVSWWGPNGACTRFQSCVYYRGFYTCSRAFPQVAKACGSDANLALSIVAPPVFLTTPVTLPYLLLY